MRGFIVLCLSAVAIAAPQGYNYGGPSGGVQQSAGFGGHLGFNSGSSVVSTSSSGNGGFLGAGHVQQVQQQQSFFSQGASIGHVQQQQQQQQQQHQEAIVSKRFYLHSAPEEHDDDYKEKHITVGVPKKNYNVVFIKAPAKSNKKTAIKISPAVNEEKTVIYVLSKKTDASDIQAEVLEHPTSTTKPEVFFIKYKTNEEAAHAQEQIQAQYDALGGSTQVSDEGVAPVTSVIGSLGDAGNNDAGSGAASAAAVGGNGFNAGSAVSHSHGGAAIGSVAGSHSNNAYLPPNFY